MTGAASEQARHRIALHDFGGHPFTVQLARALAARGHDVLYLHGGGLRAPRGPMERRATDPPQLAIEPVDLHEALRNAVGLRRLAQERRYGSELARRILAFEPTHVVSATGSLDIQRSAQKAARQSGAAFVSWLQDVQSVAVSRLLGNRLPIWGAVARLSLEPVERRLLRRSQAVIAITPDWLPLLERWGVNPDRVSVIPNWAPIAELPYHDAATDWADRHGIRVRPLFVYAGTLGRKHDPSLLTSLAADIPAATLLVVAEGAGADRLSHEPTLPSNVIVMKPVPHEELSDLLGTADVLVVVLSRDAGTFSVPSKVLSYLAAGRPILAAIPAENLAAVTVRRAGAGMVVDPSDRAGFVQAGRRLADDGGQRIAAGLAARRYAESTFDIDHITDRFEAILTMQPRADTAHSRGTDTAGGRGMDRRG